MCVYMHTYVFVYIYMYALIYAFISYLSLWEKFWMKKSTYCFIFLLHWEKKTKLKMCIFSDLILHPGNVFLMTSKWNPVPVACLYSSLIFFFFFFLRDFIFKKTLFEKLQYLKQELLYIHFADHRDHLHAIGCCHTSLCDFAQRAARQ